MCTHTYTHAIQSIGRIISAPWWKDTRTLSQENPSLLGNGKTLLMQVLTHPPCQAQKRME